MSGAPKEIWAWAGPGGRFWRPTAAEAHGVGAKCYVLGTEFDRMKEERDVLLAALKRYRWALNEVYSCDVCDMCKEMARDVGPELDKVIDECEANDAQFRAGMAALRETGQGELADKLERQVGRKREGEERD